MAEFVVDLYSEHDGVRCEEIVRCRDCEHRRTTWNGHKPNFIGDWFCSYTGGHEVKPDGFCAWGVRRVDE